MKTLIVFIFIFISCRSYLSAQIPDSLKYQSLSPYEFSLKYNADDSAILIDVREFFEYRRSRIKNAVNIPVSGNLELVADTLDKNASLFLYCYSGTRSKKAAKFFYDKGFRKLYSLDGGITLWKKEGMRVDCRRVKKSKRPMACLAPQSGTCLEVLRSRAATDSAVLRQGEACKDIFLSFSKISYLYTVNLIFLLCFQE